MAEESPIKMLSIDDVAAHLGLHRKTIEDLIHRGELGSVTVGRRYWVRADQLQEFIDRHTVDAKAN